MNDKAQCPRCSEISLKRFNTYWDTKTKEFWAEYRCDDCGHYEQMREKPVHLRRQA